MVLRLEIWPSFFISEELALCTKLRVWMSHTYHFLLLSL